MVNEMLGEKLKVFLMYLSLILWQLFCSECVSVCEGEGERGDVSCYFHSEINFASPVFLLYLFIIVSKACSVTLSL